MVAALGHAPIDGAVSCVGGDTKDLRWQESVSNPCGGVGPADDFGQAVAVTVQVRQFLDYIRHRILYVPMLCVIVAIPASQVTLYIDRRADGDLPRLMETTVDSGRAILTSIAGGLIASITLLLSMMLIVVQLAGSQYSPRTTRDWLGDRSQQWAIGLVLGATVYCLLVLRELRETSDGDPLTPHISVIAALVFGISSLIAVVRSVDHLANGVRIGAVASSITEDTVGLIRNEDQIPEFEKPNVTPAGQRVVTRPERDWPDHAVAICAAGSGWVQQISKDSILAALPEGSTARVTGVIGGFTLPNAPLMWVWPDPEDEETIEQLRNCVAVGDARTMQQDVGFGILRLVDIAVRALSPGVNDPNTANDVIVHLGVVALALWELPQSEGIRESNGRTVIQTDPDHADYLHSAFDPIRRYGSGDPTVVLTMLRTLRSLLAEVSRRELPGPTEPIEQMIAALAGTTFEDISDRDQANFDRLRSSDRH